MDERRRIEQALEMVCETAGTGGPAWLVGGSAGLMLRGIRLPSPPRDLDLYADDRDAEELHIAMRDLAIDVPAVSETGLYRSLLSHYEAAGVPIELVGGFEVRAGANRYRTEVRSFLYRHAEPVAVGKRFVKVVPLAHELWFNMLRGREDRVRLIAAEIRRKPALHVPILDELEARNDLAEEAIRQVRSRLEHAGVGDGR